ncbi:hypothetical protein HOH87_07905 [bacterium]|jgi:hypothetical protein|nr:hypothetical protein [bacterium]
MAVGNIPPPLPNLHNANVHGKHHHHDAKAKPPPPPTVTPVSEHIGAVHNVIIDHIDVDDHIPQSPKNAGKKAPVRHQTTQKATPTEKPESGHAESIATQQDDAQQQITKQQKQQTQKAHQKPKDPITRKSKQTHDHAPDTSDVEHHVAQSNDYIKEAQSKNKKARVNANTQHTQEIENGDISSSDSSMNSAPSHKESQTHKLAKEMFNRAKTVASGASTGAGIGSFFGSVVPGLGTIIGAIIGGSIGAAGSATYLGLHEESNRLEELEVTDSQEKHIEDLKLAEKIIGHAGTFTDGVESGIQVGGIFGSVVPGLGTFLGAVAGGALGGTGAITYIIAKEASSSDLFSDLSNEGLL